MKVVFVAIGQEQLGISMLSAILRRAGHETALVFDPALFHDRYYFDIPVLRDLFNRDRAVIEQAVAEKPDLLAFSVLTPTYTWCLNIAREVKARTGVPVIFGGVHPSAAPAVCLENDEVDYVCVGEGEEAILRLCDALPTEDTRPRHPIPNLWWRDHTGQIVRGPAAGFIQDLDSLPYWDKSLWEDAQRMEDNYLTMTSRGCPYRCTFCFNNFFAKLPGKGGGKYVRQRSVDNCLGELVTMKARYAYRHVDFTDDIFTLDKEWLRRFLDGYKREIGVPFTCLVHPRFIDADMARWIKDAGCDRIQMGIQSADPEYKRKQLLRMEKDVDLDGALRAMAEVGLPMKLDHILGLPGEPERAQELARELYVKFTPTRVNTYWLTHLPGIELTRDAARKGLITEDDVARIERGKTRLFHHLDNWSADDPKFQFYQRYDVLFRALPLLPGWLRKHVRAEHVPRMHPRIANALGFAVDFTNAMLRNDSDTWIYGKHYAHHLARTFFELLPASLRPARFRRKRHVKSPVVAPGSERPRRRPLPVVAQEA